MASLDDEYSWTPPSEAELKVIEARRERNNKISSLMGQYLLKGYKMLAVSCPMCDCVLLEDRSKSKYCIGCFEVDADTKKDNPAVNEEAARKAVEENQHRQYHDKEEACPRMNFEVPHQMKAQENSSNTSPPSLTVATSTTESQCVRRKTQGQNLSIHGIDLTEDVTVVMTALKEKLIWAGDQLRSTSSIHESRNLAELISESCRAITALRDL